MKNFVNAQDMVGQAADRGEAIGAFNVNNMEWAQAIIRGSVQANRPVIMQVSMGAAEYMGGYEAAYGMIDSLISSWKRHKVIPEDWVTVLHADHADYDHALEAIDAGFTSVMFDGSSLPIEKNLMLTNCIIPLAHARHCTVESEVGSIGGSEDGIYGDGEISPIEDVLTMANIHPDMMAIGIGNIHGPYPENWTGLNFEYLAQVNDALKQRFGVVPPLVLHGGSGIPREQVDRAITEGIAKVNVNTELQLAFYHALRDGVTTLPSEDKVTADKLFDPRKLLKTPTQAMQDTVVELSEQFAPKGK
jgi:fructose-bisphosphate aldolase class II